MPGVIGSEIQDRNPFTRILTGQVHLFQQRSESRVIPQRVQVGIDMKERHEGITLFERPLHMLKGFIEMPQSSAEQADAKG